MRPGRLNVLALLVAGALVGCTGTVMPGQTPGSGTGSTQGGTGSTQGGTGAIQGGTGGTGGSSNPGSGGTVAPGAPRPIVLDGQPKYYRFVRLTNEQWSNSVREVLKLPAPTPLASTFPTTVAGANEFDNNEQLLDVSSRMWADYQTAAETLAAQVTATDAALKTVYSGTQDAATFIQTFGRRAYRRPLTTAEVASYTTLFNSASTTAGSQTAFTKGAAIVIEAMLQSPYFIYRSEMGANGAPLSGYEMAAKLSLFLRNSTPTDVLLDSAAGPGKLDTPEGAVSLATTLLADPAATTVMRHFHGSMFDFEGYGQISKTGVANYKESLNAELMEASYLFFDKLFKEGLGVREMMTSTTGFVGPGLAALYGVAAPTSGYVERDLGPRRAGFFTQVPFLAANAINLSPHPIYRGVHLNHDVLCATLDPFTMELPPVPAQKPDQTNRERYEGLTMGCGGACHNSYINPLGFAFESYDGMGQWRDTENGKPINTAGSYPFAEGVKSFNGAAELMTAIAQGEQVHTCYAKKLAGYALQRDIAPSDMPLLTTLKTASMAANGSMKQVILELVKSPSFRTRVGGAQ